MSTNRKKRAKRTALDIACLLVIGLSSASTAWWSAIVAMAAAGVMAIAGYAQGQADARKL